MADRPRSLGFATDLALLRLQGADIEERPDHVVVRTPANPTYHWGNCLILDDAPAPGSLAHWVSVFAAAHPGADHVAIGIDRARVDVDPGEAAALGLTPEHDTVLVASRLVVDPRGAPPGVECRAVEVDDDRAWAALVDLEVRNEDHGDPDGHRRFVERRWAGVRTLVRDGHGAWFAAYARTDHPVATLGIFRTSRAVARFQSVLTDREHRRRGIAGALVRQAGGYALDVLGVATLVIVADPDGPAIGTYRSAGFTGAEDQWALYRAPSGTGAR